MGQLHTEKRCYVSVYRAVYCFPNSRGPNTLPETNPKASRCSIASLQHNGKVLLSDQQSGLSLIVSDTCHLDSRCVLTSHFLDQSTRVTTDDVISIHQKVNMLNEKKEKQHVSILTGFILIFIKRQPDLITILTTISGHKRKCKYLRGIVKGKS